VAEMKCVDGENARKVGVSPVTQSYPSGSASGGFQKRRYCRMEALSTMLMPDFSRCKYDRSR